MTKAFGLVYGAAIVGPLAAGTGCGTEPVIRALGLLPPPVDPNAVGVVRPRLLRSRPWS